MVNITQKLVMQLRQSPQQVLLSSLLQLPVLSLEQRIRMELETNPLLELEMDEEVDQELEESEEQTPEEIVAEEEEEEEVVEPTKEEIDWEEILNDQESFEVRIPKEKNVDTFEKPEVYQETLTDHLISQVHLAGLKPEEEVIAEYIIWNINSDGYLVADDEDRLAGKDGRGYCRESPGGSGDDRTHSGHHSTVRSRGNRGSEFAGMLAGAVIGGTTSQRSCHPHHPRSF